MKKFFAIVMVIVTLVCCFSGCETARATGKVAEESVSVNETNELAVFIGNTESLRLEADNASYSTSEFTGKISFSVMNAPISHDGSEFVCWSDVKLNGQPLNSFNSGSTSPYVTTESSNPDVCVGLRVAAFNNATPLAAQNAEKIFFDIDVFGVEASEGAVGTAEMTIRFTATANFASGETIEHEWTYIYYVENTK